jgi:hypothetical protein
MKTKCKYFILMDKQFKWIYRLSDYYSLQYYDFTTRGWVDSLLLNRFKEERFKPISRDTARKIYPRAF